MARENLWEVLTKRFPGTSQKLVECKMGCRGDGRCAAKKFVLWRKITECSMSAEDLENIELVRQSVAANIVGGNVL